MRYELTDREWAAIKPMLPNKPRGVIPAEYSMFLDFFDEYGETVWCWKDERTGGSSQIFNSEREALEALETDDLIFNALLG
jgi:hypothetical protein